LALYQQARAAMNAGNLDVARDALRNIFDWYPNGLLGDHSLLMVGQGVIDRSDPAHARKLFEDFARRETNSLTPELQLAVARTYECESDWESAIRQYTNWLQTYTNIDTHAEHARAEYSLAWANFEAGREPVAFQQFT